MKRRFLKTISVVTMSMVLGLGSISSFASDNVMEIIRDGSEKILENANTEDRNVMKLVKVASDNLLNNIKANMISDGNIKTEKVSLKDRVKK